MQRSLLFATAAFAALSTAAQATEIETVVVTASPIAGNPDRFATIIGQVSRDDILKAGGATVADALANMPGVNGTSFAAGASRPVIRGFDSNRVRVLEDDIGSFDVSDVGPDHGVPIDPLSAQSIEVVRGAATLRYGSQAIGGVVNVINNRVPSKMPSGDFAAEGSAAYNSSGNGRQVSLLADAKAGDFAFHADGFLRRAENYDTPLGTLPNSFIRGDGFSLGSSYFFGDNSRTGAAIVHYDARYGIPSDVTYISEMQTKALTRTSLDLGDGLFKTLNVDGGYATYQHSEIDPTTGTIAATFKNKEWDLRAESVLNAIGPFSATSFGLQFQHRNFSALGAAADYLSPTRTSTQAAFVFTELPIGDRIHVQAGARIEHISIAGIPASNIPTTRDFTPVSGAIGALFDVTDAVKIGVTVSTAARAPAQTELFARGPHDGPATFETGDPTLKIERANSLEGTLRLNLNHISLEGAVWSSWFDNFIYGALTGRTCDESGFCLPGNTLGLKELNYAQQGAHFWGLEGKAAIGLGNVGDGAIQADLLADMVRATFSDGTYVPRVSPWRAGGGLSFDSDRFDAGFMLLYVGARTDVAFAETPTDGYVSLDANLSWKPFPSNPDLELSLIAHNLTDDVQRNAVALNKDVVILPGRDIRLVLRAAL
ncbi:MAG: TonB-dependent receptor [Alphaproteobacteria bacterium]|nr:TonB-dependent receptor [Alphaproteobacteria bacterium]